MHHAEFGIGAYTPSEAGKLVGTSATNIRRWLFGYSYTHHGPKTAQAPLWQPQYGVDQDEPLLGFRDLIEARFVARLRAVGIGMPTIRLCLTTAAQIADDPHPFSSAHFRTDGKRLFLERMGETGKRDVIDLKTLQHAFPKVIEASFLDLEFDDDKATRWFPLARSREVVADPERSFGAPIVEDGGVPTSRIAQVFLAEGRSVDRVAQLFEIAKSAVRAALTFETQIGELKAA
ncbi:hypothetical protein DBR17_02625 [Sphingomonas sp. HMWF008]|nr:hypothetical protein DBR17_02625 [Sphingomonas sp. HMWF008]